MTEPQAIEAIDLRIAEGWPTLHPDDDDDPDYVPYCFQGEEFSKEQLGEIGAWVRFSIIWTGAEQLTQGAAPNRKWERRGYVFAQIFGPPGQGVGLLSRLATDVRTVLEGRRIDEVNMHEGASGNGKDEPDWARHNVTVRFSFEETR